MNCNLADDDICRRKGDDILPLKAQTKASFPPHSSMTFQICPVRTLKGFFKRTSKTSTFSTLALNSYKQGKENTSFIDLAQLKLTLVA